MRTQLKLMAGFSEHCIWDRDEGQYIDASTLPLSAGTLRDLALWARQMQRWGSWSDPGAKSAWTPADMEALDEQGKHLWRRVRQELDGARYHVAYHSVTQQRTLEDIHLGSLVDVDPAALGF